jgi:5'-nucleotidase
MSDRKRVLVLTNDDGVDEPGLAALGHAAGELGRLAVVAPASGQSGGSHAVSLSRPIRLRAERPGVHAVEGSPADCVRLALHHLEPGVDWVLSGINAGGNLGTDLLHSGTAAAAREAAVHGVPAIAVSHYIARGQAIDWERAARWTARVLRLLLERPWQPGTFWNVNLPHRDPGAGEPRVRLCPVDPSPLPLSFAIHGDSARYNGDYHRRARREATDIVVCFAGDIAVSRVRVHPADDFPDTQDLDGDPAIT